VRGCHDDAECGGDQICSAGSCFASCSSTRSCNGEKLCAALDAFGDVVRSPSGSPSQCRIGYRCLCADNPTKRRIFDGGTHDSGARSVDAGPDASDATADAKPPHDAALDAAPDLDARAPEDAGDGGAHP
jgi:hypothetical protein